ncbi:branched-chain amino acid aminotransferase [Streptomyces sp. SCL15-4]|uniref:branched-chain amino acid aminotransferase n=1 Tax=Streptomyces sp. SCL15-4 TaxID=2967221 RepID=UPI002966C28C|nr:branched-chain amino acid aminotransferase [Streptomyces sp. SCL15-4]
MAVPISTAAQQEPAAHHKDAPKLGFGVHFTDHMVTMRWTSARGWHPMRLEPYRPLELDPSALGLHYGQIVFEGLKAYAQADGTVALFRPGFNARRLNHSAARLAIPPLPEESFIEALQTLVAADRAWVPEGVGRSLYLRPYIMAVEPTIGVRPAREYLFVLIASPVDPFFSTEVKPVTVWVADDYVRAAPGGTGDIKFPGNYAAAFLAQQQAAEHGCDQVVWLDAVERRWVEEMGAMNLFFVVDDGRGKPAVLTPRLTGTLLPGAVRDSLIALATDAGYPVREEQVSIDRWQTGWEDGSIHEVFACGTAAVVTPVGALKRGEHQWRAPAGTGHPITLGLRRRLLDIQHGHIPDPHAWMTPVTG